MWSGCNLPSADGGPPQLARDRKSEGAERSLGNRRERAGLGPGGSARRCGGGGEAGREPHQIIHRPIITEKGTELKDQVNQYLFEVARDANKIEIKRAVESLFRVKVLQVRTLSMKGKKKNVGRSVGRTPEWKKAVATLKEGDSIEFFEGV